MPISVRFCAPFCGENHTELIFLEPMMRLFEVTNFTNSDCLLNLLYIYPMMVIQIFKLAQLKKNVLLHLQNTTDSHVQGQ